MGDAARLTDSEALEHLETVYRDERPRLIAKLLRAGRSLEEAEDLVHDVYAESLDRLPVIAQLRSVRGWIWTLFRRRVIDSWRRDRVRSNAGETKVAEETLREIIVGVGLDPLDAYVRERLVDALNDAMRELPQAQRRVLEAQVFGGKTFREIAESSGESIDTVKARKRYAVQTLTRALRHWIEE